MWNCGSHVLQDHVLPNPLRRSGTVCSKSGQTRMFVLPVIVVQRISPPVPSWQPLPRTIFPPLTPLLPLSRWERGTGGEGLGLSAQQRNYLRSINPARKRRDYLRSNNFRISLNAFPSTPFAESRRKYVPLPSCWFSLPVPFHSTTYLPAGESSFNRVRTLCPSTL